MKSRRGNTHIFHALLLLLHPQNLAPRARLLLEPLETCFNVPLSSDPRPPPPPSTFLLPWFKIFTHILRDWTSEGDSVRAAVYDPLLRALDEYVGGEHEEATATNGSEGGRDGSSGSGRRRRGGARGGTAGGDVGGDGTGSCMCSGTRERGRRGGGHPEPPEASYCSSSCADRRRTANVLVPGAGLGRLAAEVAARGYASVHANELSATS